MPTARLIDTLISALRLYYFVSYVYISFLLSFLSRLHTTLRRLSSLVLHHVGYIRLKNNEAFDEN